MQSAAEKEMEETFPTPGNRDYYAVMAHFYRGELGRIMIWRQRLDVTTNWAIVGTTAMVTFALSDPEHTPLIFMFANFLVFLLLNIEARRYRFYDAFRARVRMLEAHFIMPVVMNSNKMLQGDWRKVMSEDLLVPTFKISRRMAVLRRYRRNYLWIFLIILMAWCTKIWIHAPDSHTFQGFIGAMGSHHPLPEALFWTLFGLTYLAVGILTVASLVMRKASGEFATKAMHRKKWTL
ncbi:MAG: DUF2270 domain-containing protein [Pseudomonadales bacterium]